MKHAVLDTNVLISALILKGPTNALVSAWKEGQFQLVLCTESVEEFLRTLAYPKFQLSEELIQRTLERQLLPYAHIVTLKKIPNVITQDPPDNIFLGCAEAGHAFAIVSGDKALLGLKAYKKIPILTVRQFLNTLED